MKVIAILLCLTTCGVAYPDKDTEIAQLIGLQSKILEIAKKHPPDPFRTGTANLNKAVVRELDALKLGSLDSEQLYRLAIACALAAGSQDAGDQNWDSIFDDVSWRCARIISTRPGWRNAEYLTSMKSIFGRDGGPSLWFKDYIGAQSKLKAN